MMRRHKGNAKTEDGRVIHVLGNAFRVNDLPPGEIWAAGVCGDGKLRPFVAEELDRVG